MRTVWHHPKPARDNIVVALARDLFIKQKFIILNYSSKIAESAEKLIQCRIIKESELFTCGNTLTQLIFHTRPATEQE